jgi:hypothetical protein
MGPTLEGRPFELGHMLEGRGAELGHVVEGRPAEVGSVLEGRLNQGHLPLEPRRIEPGSREGGAIILTWRSGQELP